MSATPNCAKMAPSPHLIPPLPHPFVGGGDKVGERHPSLSMPISNLYPKNPFSSLISPATNRPILRKAKDRPCFIVGHRVHEFPDFADYLPPGILLSVGLVSQPRLAISTRHWTTFANARRADSFYRPP